MSIGGAEKKIAHDGPRYCAIYEIDGPHVLISPGWAKAVEEGRWPTQVRPSRTTDGTHYTRCASTSLSNCHGDQAMLSGDAAHPGDDGVDVVVGHLAEIDLARHRQLERPSVAADTLRKCGPACIKPARYQAARGFHLLVLERPSRRQRTLGW